ncbi:MAG: hypothetical protein LDL12_05650 [Anaerolinea sp.]|nr:hypothetical protein [Anaerolinea sp.]
MTTKQVLKRFLGEVPFTAELYWLLRQNGRPITRFSLKRLQDHIPQLMEEAARLASAAQPTGRHIFIFASLHYWIEHAAMLALGLAAQGNRVTLGYLPYGEWLKPIDRFDLRRQNVYARRVLEQLSPLVQCVSFLNLRGVNTLPAALLEAVQTVSTYDTQYTLQIEEFDPGDATYQLRLERNTAVAQTALAWLQANRPDTVIVPNGTIQEMGVVYRVARHLDIPAVTYEFGDQRQRIWLALNSEIMRQDTDALWQAYNGAPLTEEQMGRMKSLMMARQRATIWQNFARRWQSEPAQGGQKLRAELGLDERPVVLLATNVLGDSLTLGRQVFSRTMAEWISRTVQYFIGRPDVQLVIRVHPGEVLTRGQSMVDVVRQVLPRLPEHIHLIKPKDKVNTYDLVEVADLGLVYTTTVGMEMAMAGLPVLVAGRTHYRGRGFTYDPESWVTYFKMLGQMTDRPQAFRLSDEQVHTAWQYAYHFFFDFPQPFPWHLVRLWDDVDARPLATVFSDPAYVRTFAYLAGQPVTYAVPTNEVEQAMDATESQATREEQA